MLTRNVVSAIKFIAVLSVPLVFAARAEASTWYVATTGNNANACTSSGSPCQTLAGVMSKNILPGDVVEVANGSYAGVTWTKSGNASAGPITVRGYSTSCPATAISDINSRGERPNPGVTLTSRVDFASGVSYVTFTCFKGTGGALNFNADQNVNNITVSDMNLTGANGGTAFTFGDLGVITSQAAMPHHITITRSYATLFGMCMEFLANNVTVTDNECNRMSASTGDDDHVYPYGDTHLYRNNYFHGNVYTDQPGAHSDCFQVFNLGQSNETFRYARNITIDRNTCMNFDEMIITSNNTSDSSLMQNWTVTNNVFAYSRLNGGGVGGGGFGSTLNVRFYHNTTWNAAFGCGRSDSTVTATVTATNNILDGTFSQGTRCTLTQSSNSTTSTAAVVSTANGDFHLQAGSPAINSGVTGLGVTNDRDGNPRDGSPDRGAYERVTAGVPSAPSNLRIVPSS